MTDKELLSQLKELKNITPMIDWKASQRDVLRQQIYNGQAGLGLNWTAKFNLIMGRVFQPTVIALVIFVFLGSASLASWTSGNAKPGDSLYIAKRLSEKTQMTVALTKKSKTKLNLKFASERAKELNQIIDNNNNQVNASKVAELKNDFNNEINKAKQRLAKITESKTLDSQPEDEVQFFVAGKEKNNERLDIALPETKESEKIKKEIKEETKKIEITKDKIEKTKTEAILEEVGQLITEENYKQAVEVLDQIEEITIENTKGDIDQTVDKEAVDKESVVNIDDKGSLIEKENATEEVVPVEETVVKTAK